MQLAALVAIGFLVPAYAAPNLTGTWVLDRGRSEFGAADALRQFVVYLNQTGDHLDITTLVVDAAGKRVSYRRAEREGLLLRVNADAGNVSEDWRITSPRELTITRLITTQYHVMRQRLVLVRSTQVE